MWLLKHSENHQVHVTTTDPSKPLLTEGCFQERSKLGTALMFATARKVSSRVATIAEGRHESRGPHATSHGRAYGRRPAESARALRRRGQPAIRHARDLCRIRQRDAARYPHHDRAWETARAV